ncbi:MAG: SmpA / OmlA family [Phormidium sp. OSCR]|nr:MAG: SmpA / OmlA family [Phormidium sp. OSCR]
MNQKQRSINPTKPQNLAPRLSPLVQLFDRQTILKSSQSNKVLITLLTLSLGLISQPVTAQASPRLTPQDCEQLQVGMTQSELDAILGDLDIEPERQTPSPGNSLLQWIDEDSGAVLLAVLRNQIVAEVSCFGISPQVTENSPTHQLCTQAEIGMTLEETRQALGTPGEPVASDSSLSAGLLWQWTNPARQEVAVLAFSSFNVLSGKTCFFSQTEEDTTLQLPDFIESFDEIEVP